MHFFSFLLDIFVWTSIGAFAGNSIAEQEKQQPTQKTTSIISGVVISLVVGIISILNYGLPDIGIAERNTLDVMLVTTVFFLIKSKTFRNKLRRRFRPESIHRTLQNIEIYLKGGDIYGNYR